MEFLQLESVVIVAVIGALASAMVGGLYYLLKSGLWRYRKWKYKKNWSPITNLIDSWLVKLFGSISLAPEPTINVQRGDVQAASPQAFVSRRDGKISPSHIRKKIIIIASDEEVKGGVPSDESVINLVRQTIAIRGDPFLAYLSPDMIKAFRRLSLDQMSTDLQYDSELTFVESDMDSQSVEETTVAVEDMFNAGKLTLFTEDVAQSYAGEPLSSQARNQTSNEFWKRYDELLKEFGGFYLKCSEKQIDCINKKMKGILIPPSISPQVQCKDRTVFLWTTKEGIISYGSIHTFHSGSFGDLWKRFGKNLLAIEGISTSETKSLHENWARGLGGIKGKSKEGKKSRGDELRSQIIEIDTITQLQRPISSADLKKLGLPKLGSIVKITIAQVREILEFSMPKP